MRGEQNGIIWEVNERRPVDITIYDTNGNVLHTEEYQCIYEPNVDDRRDK